MKKIVFALSAVALIFATSCKKEQNVNPPVDVPEEDSFIATIYNGANPQNAPVVNDGMSTMTSIDKNNNVIWTAGDTIYVNGKSYTTTTGEATAVFTPSVKDQGATGSTYHAFYAVEKPSATSAAATLPATQICESNNVSNLPMYATCDSNRILVFHNICAVLKVTIPSYLDGADNIVVSSDERMNGDFTITAEGEGYKAVVTAPTKDADKQVTIRKSSGTFATDEVVYIAVPAQTYNHLKVEFFDGANSMWRRTLDTCTLNVNTVNTFTVPSAMPSGLCFTAKGGDVTVTFNIVNATHQIQTSIDEGISWQDYTSGTGITLAADEKVYFQAATDQTTATAFATSTTNSNFTFSSSNGSTVEASGNIMSLYGPSCPNLKLSTYAFAKMFFLCNTLTTAPALPADTLANNCYYYMFYGSGLQTSPALPAEALAVGCYEGMFYGCANLQNTPTLPALTVPNNAYKKMFMFCTSISSAALSAIYLGDASCEEMFYKRDTNYYYAIPVNWTVVNK